jgi:hypothetical protein
LLIKLKDAKRFVKICGAHSRGRLAVLLLPPTV